MFDGNDVAFLSLSIITGRRPYKILHKSWKTPKPILCTGAHGPIRVSALITQKAIVSGLGPSDPGTVLISQDRSTEYSVYNYSGYVITVA